MEGETNRYDSVGFHVEVAGNFNKGSEQIITWIKQEGIRKEQIINISANETTMESGDCELVLYYLKKQEPDYMPLDHLEFHFIKNMMEWDVSIATGLRVASSGCDVVAITHTPKSIGRLNVQIIFYLKCAISTMAHVNSLDDKSGNIDSIMKK